jgi:hypothetical protein
MIPFYFGQSYKDTLDGILNGIVLLKNMLGDVESSKVIQDAEAKLLSIKKEVMYLDQQQDVEREDYIKSLINV